MPSDKHGYWFTEQYPIGPLTVNVMSTLLCAWKSTFQLASAIGMRSCRPIYSTECDYSHSVRPLSVCLEHSSIASKMLNAS